MARLGTALERRREADPPPSALGGLGRRLAGALERRGAAGADRRADGGQGADARAGRSAGRAVGPRWRTAGGTGAGPFSDRLVRALERHVTRTLERRFGGSSSRRPPGALERRLVAVLERGRPAERRPVDATDGSGGALGRIGNSIGRREIAGGLRSRRPATLRALVLGIVARGMVRTLALFVRVLARGLVGAPARRLARLLARRTVRPASAGQVGFLALLLGALAVLVRRLAGVGQARRAAVRVARLLVGNLLRLLRRLVLRVLRLAFVLLRRELRRGAKRRRG